MLRIIDDESVAAKIDKVHSLVRDKRVIVAYSGGVDSSVLASLVSDVATETRLVMQIGESVGIGEQEFAQREAESMGHDLYFMRYEEYKESEEYRLNPSDRCYYCKSLLHNKLEEYRRRNGFDLVVNGTNASDLGGHRPGYKAVLEKGALSPLVLAGLTKPEIRRIASDRGLESADKPATPCIASRVITGVEISPKILREIREGEHALKRAFGFRIIRMRHDGRSFIMELGEQETIPTIAEVQQVLAKSGVDREVTEIRRYRPYVPSSHRYNEI